MLAARLLVYRFQGDRIVPAFLGEADHPWLRALIDERERFVGRPRRELMVRSQEPLPIAAPPRKRVLAAQVLEHLAAPPRRVDPPPRKLRSALFAAAATSALDRDHVLVPVAASLGITVEVLESGLFADLPDQIPVTALTQPTSPVELGTRANLALVRGLLPRADRVVIEIEGNALPIVRLAKLRGLIVTVAVEENRTQIEVSGPMAIFHHTRVYGRRLGEIVPLLCWCSRFRLRAKCVLPEGQGELQLATGDPIFPAEEPKAFDSRLEADFAKALRKAAPAWDLIRDPEPLRAGDGLVFPDFALSNREDRSLRWLIEIVGFWTPEYLARKLAAYRAANASNLVLCIHERLGCADGDLPSSARVVRFRRRVDPRAVLEAIVDAPMTSSRPVATRSSSEVTTATRPPTIVASDHSPTQEHANPLLEAIREVASASRYGNAFIRLVEIKVGRPIALAELIELCRAGHVALNRPTADIAIRPLDPPRPPVAVDRDTVVASIRRAIAAARWDERPPLYHLVREWYDWMTPEGRDLLWPVIVALARDDLVELVDRRGRITIDVKRTGIGDGCRRA